MHMCKPQWLETICGNSHVAQVDVELGILSYALSTQHVSVLFEIDFADPKVPDFLIRTEGKDMYQLN